jgi:hypothetical protein
VEDQFSHVIGRTSIEEREEYACDTLTVCPQMQQVEQLSLGLMYALPRGNGEGRGLCGVDESSTDNVPLREGNANGMRRYYDTTIQREC